MRFFVLLTLMTLSLAGCLNGTDDGSVEEVVLTQKEVAPDDSASGIVRCGGGAVVDVETENSKNGTITVQVREGAAIPVFDHDFGPAATTYEEALGGGSGYWELTVHRTLEFEGKFTVRLWC